MAATEQDEYVCLSRDISERRRMEQALRTSELRYRTVIAHAPIVLFAADATGMITLSAFAVFRATPAIIDALHRALAGETVSRTIQMGEQIAEEEALRASEKLYHSVVSNAPIVLFSLDAAGIYTLHDGKSLQTMGLTPGQLVGLSALEVNRGSPSLLAALRRALGGETLTATIQVCGKVFELQLTPVRTAEGDLTSVVGVGTDNQRARAGGRSAALPVAARSADRSRESRAAIRTHGGSAAGG